MHSKRTQTLSSLLEVNRTILRYGPSDLRTNPQTHAWRVQKQYPLAASNRRRVIKQSENAVNVCDDGRVKNLNICPQHAEHRNVNVNTAICFHCCNCTLERSGNPCLTVYKLYTFAQNSMFTVTVMKTYFSEPYYSISQSHSV